MEIQAIRSTATVEPTAQSKAASAAAPQKPAGPPPAGGPRPAKPAAAQAGTQSTESTSSTSSTSDTKKTYDKRDANQDGTVSSQEELLYTLTHPNEESKSQMTASASQLQNGLKAYQQG